MALYAIVAQGGGGMLLFCKQKIQKISDALVNKYKKSQMVLYAIAAQGGGGMLLFCKQKI